MIFFVRRPLFRESVVARKSAQDSDLIRRNGQSCADSRIAPEYAFDSGRGDVFVCRVAGDYVTPNLLASFKFAIDA